MIAENVKMLLPTGMISINLKSEINDLIIYPFSSVSLSFCRTMLCIVAANAVVLCLAAYLSVCHVRVLCLNGWRYGDSCCAMRIGNYSVSKKEATWCLIITLAYVDRFSKFFHQLIREKIVYVCTRGLPPHLQYVATLPSESRNRKMLLILTESSANCWHVTVDTLNISFNTFVAGYIRSHSKF